MNNPFTSNRTLFDKVPKPARPSQQDPSLTPNHTSNPRSTQQIGTRNLSIPATNNTSLNNNLSSNTGSFNTKNIGNGTNYLQTTNSNNNNTSINNNKVDLNFRSEFRPSTFQDNIVENKKYFQVNFDNSMSNTSMSSNLNTSSNNANLFPSTNSYQNKVISDKQYPPYQQQSQQYPQYGQSKSYQSSQNIQGSNIPSMTLPSASSSNNFNTNSNKFGSFGNSGALGGSASKSNISGVEKQKFTFGVGSAQDSNNRQLQYDRSKFVNREQFTSPYQNLNNNTPGQKISNIPISPIQQKSKHMLMMDEHSSSFMDIDAMGEDIEKILASSKNQEQLCKLLGIPNTNPHTNDKKFQDVNPNLNSNSNRSHQYQRSYSDHSNIEGNNKNMYNTGSNNSINFSKKYSSPQKNANKNPGYDMYQADYNSKNINHQVFDYQSQNNIQTTSNNNKNLNISYTSNHPINQSNKLIKSPNINNIMGNTNHNMAATNTNPQNYSSELQETIQNEMRKLSIRGRVRTFLSASDKIETVKYNMEFI